MAKTLTQDSDEFRIDKLDLSLSHIATEDDTPVGNPFSDRRLAEMRAGGRALGRPVREYGWRVVALVRAEGRFAGNRAGGAGRKVTPTYH